ncbi:MAG: Ig-like domain-containing protein [Dehalococcoidia bacterium]|nr:Ig-like domain-containing protein [Dehalococcoidia bacterium]
MTLRARVAHALYLATHDVLTIPLASIAVLLALLVTFAATRVPVVPLPPFAIAPAGDEVSRLAPIRVTYRLPPAQQDGGRMVTVVPAVPGTYAWLDERTLLFQPDFPGYERGRDYEVHVAPQPDALLNEEVVHHFTTTGALKVTMVIPSPDDVDVAAESPLLVQFTRGVAPLTLLAEAERQGPVLTFDPPLPGRGEWLNTALYRYVPDPALPPSTRYTVRLAAGLSSAADGQLAEDFSWAFTTYGPDIVKVTPDNNTRYASPEQPVTVEFNQPMNQASAEAAFSLRLGADPPVAGTFAWRNDDRTMTFTPRQLALESTYTAQVAAGVMGRNGGQTPTMWSSTFVTVGVPRVLRSEKARYSGVIVEYNNPLDPTSFEGKVTISGHRPDEIRLNVNGTTLTIYGYFNPSTEYEVDVAAGGLDRYGQVAPGATVRFTMPEATPSITLPLPGRTGTYSATQESILYMQTLNTASASFSLYRLSDADFRTWQERGGRGLTREWRPSSPPIREWQVSVEKRLDWVVTSQTSLAADGRPLPTGNYWIEANIPEGRGSVAAFSVVDTHLVAKTSQDELLIWAVDLATGTPLPGLEVEVPWGTVIGEPPPRTDEHGLTRVKIPIYYSSQADRTHLVQVHDQGRYGVVDISWGGVPSAYYYGGGYYGGFVREYVGHLYGDRVIYRPGEQVLLKGVIRADDDARYPIPDPATQFVLTISGPRQSTLATIPVTLNEFGTFEASFDMPPTAVIGDYTASVAPVESQAEPYNRTIMTATFSVIEFRPVEFEVGLRAEEVRVAGEPITATTTASFLFGGQMAGAAVKWDVNITPRVLRGTGDYAGFSFNDIDPYQSSVTPNFRRLDGSGTTDSEGTFVFTVPTTQVPDYVAQNYELSATVLDQNGQSLRAGWTTAVFAGDIVAGVRPVEYLGTQGRPSTVRFVTMTNTNLDAPNRPLTVRIYQRTWVTTKIASADGSAAYRSQPVDTLVDEIATRTDENSEGRLDFTPSSVGSFHIVAEVADDRGRVTRAGTYLYVTGSQSASWRIANGDSFDLIADRDSYSPGDVAEILVPAPFDRAIGLVTVERGKNLRQEVQRFESNSERIRVPIELGSMPNVFVSVVLYRPPTAEDPVPRYALATINLPVSTASRVLKVDIAADKAVARPRDTVSYRLKVTDDTGKGVRAELSVAVVDKAVILLAEERGPNGLRAFWFERPLRVSTASSLAVSIDRSNDTFRALFGGPKGGDGFSDDGTRSEFKNTAFWEAQVVTDDNGEATVDVPLPDNVTTWRLQARAVAEGTRVGEAVHELLTTRAVIARPALPRFVRAGDSLVLRMLVRNGTNNPSEAIATIEAEGVELADAGPRQVSVPAQGSVFAEWTAKVPEGLEREASVTFTATTPDGLRDAVRIRIPIHEALTPETTATGGVVEGESALEAVYLPTFAILTDGRLELSLSATSVPDLSAEMFRFERSTYDGALDYLTRLEASLAVHRQGRSDESARIRSDIAGLLSFVDPSGGFRPCAICPLNPDLSTLAMIALGEARAAGFTVSADTLEAGRRYLKADLGLSTDVARPTDPNRRAKVLYAVVRSGRASAEAATLRSLYEQYRGQLNNSGRAYLLMALHEAGISDSMTQSLVTDLTSRAIPSANGSHWEDAVDDRLYSQSTILTTSVAIEALTRVSPQHLLIRESVRWLSFARAQETRLMPKVERARSMQALAAYAANTGEGSGDYEYDVRLNGESIISGRTSGGNLAASSQIPLADLKVGEVNILDFTRQAVRGRMYYITNLFYRTPATDIEALNRGFSLAREYSLPEEGQRKTSEVHVGDLVQVKLTVIVGSEMREVDVTDLLPAGLEPIDPRLKITPANAIRELQEQQQKLDRSSSQYVAPWHRWYYSPWTNVQVKDDRLLLRAPRLARGVHEYVYLARATTPGTFFVPPAVAFQTSFPEVFGRTDSGKFVVLP